MDTPPAATVLTDIKVHLARIEERQTASADAADHRHRNLMMRMDAFVPRAEIERENRATNDRIDAGLRRADERHDDLENQHGGRLKRLEGIVSRVGWAIVAAWIAGIGAVGTVGKLLLDHH